MNKSAQSKLLVIRGDWFDTNFPRFVCDPAFESSRSFLTEKVLTVTHTDESYRTINSWSEAGLIIEDSSREAGWRKFSISDVCWISILSELRKLGFGLERLSVLKKTILRATKNEPVTVFHFYIAAALTRSDVHLVISPSGKGEVGLEAEFEISETLGRESITHVVLDLSTLIKTVIKRVAISQEKKFSARLVEKELSVLHRISTDNHIRSVELQIKDRKIRSVNYTKKFSNLSNVIDYVKASLDKGGFREITLKMENGKVVSLEECEKR